MRHRRRRGVYREKISGVASRRPQLEKLLYMIGPGDAVLVTRLDRLARSTRDLLNILDKISKAGAQFKSLREAWADTTPSVGRLMVTIIGGIGGIEKYGDQVGFWNKFVQEA